MTCKNKERKRVTIIKSRIQELHFILNIKVIFSSPKKNNFFLIDFPKQ